MQWSDTAFLFLMTVTSWSCSSTTEVTMGRVGSKKSLSVIYLYPNASDAEQKQQFMANYTREVFGHVGNSVLNYPVFLLLDHLSFIRHTPALYRHFRHLVRLHDIQKEITDSEDDFFGDMYRLEEMMDKEDANSVFVDEQRLQARLRHVFTVPRHFRSSEVYRNGVGDFISRKMGQMGLVVGLQQFAPPQLHGQFFGETSLPLGSNVFGIYPSRLWGTPEDRVLVLGAHWDTWQDSDGFNDNGSGLAAILEVARVMTQARCSLTTSVIFAAFDMEEIGNQGSLEFVHRFLIPQVLTVYNQSSIAGAIVIDTVLNANVSEGSQILSESMKRLRGMAEAITNNKYRGDFINVVKRKGHGDDLLAGVFSKHWSRADGRFKAIEAELEFSSQVPSMKELERDIDFLRSDHSRFWVANHPRYQSLPAILLTDTGPYRGQMKDCYHRPCDSARPPNKAEFANFDFYFQLVRALLDTTMDISGAQCKNRIDRTLKNDVGSNLLSSPIATLVAAITVGCHLGNAFSSL